MAKSGLVEIAAIADPSEANVEKSAASAPGALRLQSLGRASEQDLDGISIATPSARHAEQTIAALERGLAVFCQKPLGRDVSEVRATIDVARTQNRLLGVDLSYRYTQAMQKIRPLVRSGELGHIFAVDLVFHNAYGPQQPWFYDPHQAGGGCVVDLGIHLVDAAFWVLDAPLVGVRSRLFHKGERINGRAEVCEDYATARLDLAGGTAINLSLLLESACGTGCSDRSIFYGTEGGAALRNVNGSFHDFTAEHFTRTAHQLLSEPPDVWGGGAAVDWARQTCGRQRLRPAVERLVDVTAALDAIYERASDRLGRTTADPDDRRYGRRSLELLARTRAWIGVEHGTHVALATMGHPLSPTQRQEAARDPWPADLRKRVSARVDGGSLGRCRATRDNGCNHSSRSSSPTIVHLNGYAHGALISRAPTRGGGALLRALVVARGEGRRCSAILGGVRAIR